jgi:hypothetical protein
MMRTVRYLLPVLVLLGAASCATYNAKVLQSVGDVAVISIQCRRLVETGGVSGWESTAKAWAKSEAFDLVPAASRVRSDVFGVYADSLPCSFVDEQELLASEAYQGLGSDGVAMLSRKEFSLPEGYLPVSSDSRKGVQKLISRLPEAEGFLWAEVTYSLDLKDEFIGFQFATMKATLTLTILDRRGRGALRHTEIADDPTDLRIGGIGAMSYADVASAAMRATTQASAAMARWLEDHAAR